MDTAAGASHAQTGLGTTITAGRFRTVGVARGPLPGVFTVVAVDERASTLRLQDGEGRAGTVYVDANVFDVDDLEVGDLVKVEFKGPALSGRALEARGIRRVKH